MDGCARAGAVRAGKPCPSGLMAGESRSLESAEMRRIHPVTAPIRSHRIAAIRDRISRKTAHDSTDVARQKLRTCMCCGNI
jgi:hypothetical protein